MFVNLLRSFVICKAFLMNGSGESAGRGYAGVCSKGVSSNFVRGKRGSVIAARNAGRRRGNGRNGRRSRDIGRRSLAKRGGLIKVGGIESASRAANHQTLRRITMPRG